MDKLGSQVFGPLEKEVKTFGGKVHFYPACCTDSVQAIDHHGGATLKKLMQALMKTALTENPEFYDE